MESPCTSAHPSPNNLLGTPPRPSPWQTPFCLCVIYLISFGARSHKEIDMYELPPLAPPPPARLRRCLRPCAVHDCKNLLAISHNCQCDVATNCGNMLHTRPDKPRPQPKNKSEQKLPRSANVAPVQWPDPPPHSSPPPQCLLLSNMAYLKLFDVLPFSFADMLTG